MGAHLQSCQQSRFRDDLRAAGRGETACTWQAVHVSVGREAPRCRPTAQLARATDYALRRPWVTIQAGGDGPRKRCRLPCAQRSAAQALAMPALLACRAGDASLL